MERRAFLKSTLAAAGALTIHNFPYHLFAGEVKKYAYDRIKLGNTGLEVSRFFSSVLGFGFKLWSLFGGVFTLALLLTLLSPFLSELLSLLSDLKVAIFCFSSISLAIWNFALSPITTPFFDSLNISLAF